MYSVFMVSLSDSSAYIIGKLIKGPRPFKWLSPSKTYSGYVGSITCVILYGQLYGICGNMPSIMFCILFTIIAGFGDLFGSLLKRVKDIQDSSDLIPGHGGLWDRWDSFLPIGPFVAWYYYIAL